MIRSSEARRRDAGPFHLAAATVSPERRAVSECAGSEDVLLILAGSAAGGVVWGWLLRRERRRRGVAAHVLALTAVGAVFPAAAAWLGDDVRLAITTGLAVAAGLAAHLLFRLALRRRAAR